MCLTKNRHFPIYKPLVADEDIFVYKLTARKDNILKSPYRCTPIIPNQRLYAPFIPFPSVYHGYHALFYLKNALVKPVPVRDFFIQPTIAVIPKDTRFYLGRNNDIVAEQMIVLYNDAYPNLPQPDLIKYVDETGTFRCPQVMNTLKHILRASELRDLDYAIDPYDNDESQKFWKEYASESIF